MSIIFRFKKIADQKLEKQLSSYDWLNIDARLSRLFIGVCLNLIFTILFLKQKRPNALSGLDIIRLLRLLFRCLHLKQRV